MAKSILSDIHKLMFVDGDVSVIISHNEKKHQLLIPSFMLKCRSDIFAKMLEINMKEKGNCEIDMTSYFGIPVLLMLEWIMTDVYKVFNYARIDICFQIETEHYFELLILADMYQLTSLRSKVESEILNLINYETSNSIKELAMSSPLALDEIIRRCDNYQSITPKMHHELNEIIFSHHFKSEIFASNTHAINFSQCSKLIDYAKLISQNIYLVPIPYNRLSHGIVPSHYFVYQPVLECEMTQRFPFLQDNWKKMFWQMKVIDPDSKFNTMEIYYLKLLTFKYNPNINNIYGLKCCYDKSYSKLLDPKDEIVIRYELNKPNNGYNLHIAFLNSIKKSWISIV